PPAVLPSPPAGLLVELVVPSPKALYDAVRTVAGPEARFPDLPWLVFASLGTLPAEVGGAVALERPLLGVAVAGDDGSVSALLACPVRSGAEVLAALTTGTPPPRQGALDPKTGLSVLTGGTGPVLGVLDDWLLFGTDEGVLRAAGPYVARTLKQKPLPTELLVASVGTAALRGPLDRAVSRRWQASRDALARLAEQAASNQGRPPDFGDPAAILAKADANVTELLETLKASEQLRLALTSDGAVVELGLDLEPTAGSSVERATKALTPTPLESLGALPSDTVLSLVTRVTGAGPAANDVAGASAAQAAAPMLKTIAERLGPDGERALTTATERVLRNGDGTTAFGLTPKRSVVVRRSVTDPDEAERALCELFSLLQKPPLRAVLAPWMKKPRESDLGLAWLDGPGHRVEIALKPSQGARPPFSRVDVTWAVGKGELFMAASTDDVRPDLARLTHPQTETLGGVPEIRSLVARQKWVSTALLLNLSNLLGGPRPLPLMLGWGRLEERAHASLLLSGGAVGYLGMRLQR
ncbi:MAG TPA: hypothetical protein VNN72_00850, partial [Polyangiaceae bacterium]|nr:hypothetical protein [Polyangiaceae bacterium]